MRIKDRRQDTAEVFIVTQALAWKYMGCPCHLEQCPGMTPPKGMRGRLGLDETTMVESEPVVGQVKVESKMVRFLVQS